MKAELLINLKISSGNIIPAGTVFDSAVAPIPEFIMKRVHRGSVRIIDWSEAVSAEKPVQSALPAQEVSKELNEPVELPSEKEEDNLDAKEEPTSPVKKILSKAKKDKK